MFATGGRGGDVHVVTTLADYHDDEAPIEGSLRAAVDAEGPRIVVFRVSGTIALERPLRIGHPDLTIAGQSAPGEGVTIGYYGLRVNAPNVILRYLRVRPGDVSGTEQDAISVRAGHVVIDHCSTSWGTDETLSVSNGASDVTIQWTLITEGLNNSVHHKGAHGYGSLLSGVDDVTIHHTAYAYNRSRNPRPKDMLLDFRNNLIYGFGDQAGYNKNDYTRMNYVANYLYPISYSQTERAFEVGGVNTRVYAARNVLHNPDDLESLEDWQMIQPPDGMTAQQARDLLHVETPFAAPSVRTHSAREAFARILADAGATRPARDAVDRRIVEQIRSGTGRIIDAQREVGGWPPLVGGTPPPDADRDGMPDAWERGHALDPNSKADASRDADGDGYTNVEEYLNGTDPSVVFAWTPPPEIAPPNGTAFTGDSLRVEITSSGEAPVHAAIHYTLNGAEPSALSPRYDGPFAVAGSTHVRAKVIAPGTHSTAAYAAYDQLPWHAAVERAASANGLRYAYFEADDWDEGAEMDAQTAVDSGVASGIDVSTRQRTEGVAFQFEGYLDVPRDGIYTFWLRDGYRSRLFVDGAFVTRGFEQGDGAGKIALRAGLHAFRLMSLHEDEAPPPQLFWKGPHFDKTLVPASVFRHDES